MKLNRRVFVTVLLAVNIVQVYGWETVNVYMDSNTCGTTIPANRKDVFIVQPRGQVNVPSPPASCKITLESTESDDNELYKFFINIKEVQIQNCLMQLKIIDGPNTDSPFARVIGCTTSAPDFVFTSNSSITLLLNRAGDEYMFGNDFKLRIQLDQENTTDIDEPDLGSLPCYNCSSSDDEKCYTDNFPEDGSDIPTTSQGCQLCYKLTGNDNEVMRGCISDTSRNLGCQDESLSVNGQTRTFHACFCDTSLCNHAIHVTYTLPTMIWFIIISIVAWNRKW